MPSSDAKTQANKANAEHSTGPRTEAGKHRSSQNARTHGFTARRCFVPPADEPAFHDLRTGLEGEIAPHGELESEMFEQLLAAAWSLRRAQIEQSRLVEDAGGSITETDPKKFQLLETYIRRLERSQKQALTELRKLQTEREYRAMAVDTGFANEPVLDASPLADQTAISRLYRQDELGRYKIHAAEAKAKLQPYLDHQRRLDIMANSLNPRYDEASSGFEQTKPTASRPEPAALAAVAAAAASKAATVTPIK